MPSTPISYNWDESTKLLSVTGSTPGTFTHDIEITFGYNGANQVGPNGTPFGITVDSCCISSASASFDLTELNAVLYKVETTSTPTISHDNPNAACGFTNHFSIVDDKGVD